MPTVKLRYPIVPGRPLVVEIPPEIDAGEVEVLIHLPDHPAPSSKKTISELMGEFAQRPVRRTKEQIDAELAEERTSWE